jgi:ABC-type transport system involved in multi-copper enzyme maturation permease subunit
MITAFRAELKKLLTVRSTYYLLGIVFLLISFLSFYIAGWHLHRVDLLSPTALSGDITIALSSVSVFVALIAVLLMTHEYRYNTIIYSLTLSNNRSKVMLAKILVITGLSIIFTLFFATYSPLVAVLGIHIHHLHLVPQTLHYWSLLWRCLFFGWGYAMAGLVIAALIRNQVGAIIALFIVPTVVEGLLQQLLNNNVVYLPFSALHQVIGSGRDFNSRLSSVHAAMVFMGYIIIAWIVTWILFLRRDAE